MNRKEFAAVMAYIQSGCGHAIDATRAEVYWDLLKDVPLQTLQLAARAVLLGRTWPSFPQVGEIRAAVVDIEAGGWAVTSGEAWGFAQRAARNTDLEVDGSMARAMKDVPEIVRKAIRDIGMGNIIRALVRGNGTVMQSQFIKAYESVVARQRKVALLPESMRQEIVGPDAMPAIASEAIKMIGQEKPTPKKGRGK